MVAAALLGVGVSTAPQAKAANLYWDTNGVTGGVGGTGAWDTTTANWSTSTAGTDSSVVANFTNADTAFFGGTAGTITLSAPLTIGGLVFTASGDTLTGSTLTLDTSTGYSPTINVDSGNNGFTQAGTRATISSIIAGTKGLVKTGDGTLVLTAADTYTGATIVQNGTLIAATQAQLGNSTGFISVMGGGSVGFAGGTLVLGSGSIVSTAATFTRDFSLSGRGDMQFGAGVMQFLGNNTLSGLVSFGSNVDNRLFGEGGVATFSGKVRLGGSETYLYGNTIISGVISGGYNTATSIAKANTTFSTELVIAGKNTM